MFTSVILRFSTMTQRTLENIIFALAAAFLLGLSLMIGTATDRIATAFQDRADPCYAEPAPILGDDC